MWKYKQIKSVANLNSLNVGHPGYHQWPNKQTDLNGDDLQKGWGDVVHTMPWCWVVGQKILSENKIVKNKPLQTKTTPKTKQAMIIELRKLSEALSYMY